MSNEIFVWIFFKGHPVFLIRISAVGPCGSALKSATGWISPEYYDSNGRYENNLDCWWTIVADDGYMVQLYIIEMDIADINNCSGDYLEVCNNSIKVIPHF